MRSEQPEKVQRNKYLTFWTIMTPGHCAHVCWEKLEAASNVIFMKSNDGISTKLGSQKSHFNVHRWRFQFLDHFKEKNVLHRSCYLN